MSWRNYDQPPPKRYRPDPSRGGWMPPPNPGYGGYPPPNRGPNRGPPNGPPSMQPPMMYNQRDRIPPPNRGPSNRGPSNRGPPNRGPPNRGPPNRGPANRGPPNAPLMYDRHRRPPPIPQRRQPIPPPNNNNMNMHNNAFIPPRPGYPPHNNNSNITKNNNDMMPRSHHKPKKIVHVNNDKSSNNNNENASTQVMHISKGENNDEFAIVLSQIYGSPLIDSIPCGETVKDSIVFDGRIKLELILRYLPHAINSPKKTVRVFEVSCLSSQDQKNYNEFVSYYTKIERACVVDKEYAIGIILYLIPPKLLKAQFDFSKIKRKNDKKSRKNKKKDIFSNNYNDIDASLLRGPITIHEYLGFERPSTNAWVICITSKSKILKHKMKLQAKKQQQDQQPPQPTNNNNNNNNNETKTSNDNSNNTTIENENDKDLGFLSSSDSENNFEQKTNENEPKSELLIELEKLYDKLGQPFNYPKQFE